MTLPDYLILIAIGLASLAFGFAVVHLTMVFYDMAKLTCFKWRNK